MRSLPYMRMLELASHLLPEGFGTHEVCSILVGIDSLGATIEFEVAPSDDQLRLVLRWVVAQRAYRARVAIVRDAQRDCTLISAAWLQSVPGVDPIRVTVWGRLTPTGLRVLADEAGLVVDDSDPANVNAWQLLEVLDGAPVADQVT